MNRIILSLPGGEHLGERKSLVYKHVAIASTTILIHNLKIDGLSN